MLALHLHQTSAKSRSNEKNYFPFIPLPLLKTRIEISRPMPRTATMAFVALLLFQIPVNGETNPESDTSYWHFKGNSSLNFNQIGVTSWAEGGESSLAGTAYLSYTANYQKDNVRSEHQLNLAFGIMRTELKKIKKTEDKVDLTSSLGFRALGNWFYTSQINIKTQFAEGFKYPNDTTVVSDFMAPAYLTASLGMQYNPAKSFSLFLSPASGKFTFVTNQTLADGGTFGVTPAVKDTAGKIITPGKNIKAEFGINLTARFNRPIFSNVNLDSKLELYNNYLDEDRPNRWNIDINWETAIVFTINKFLSSSLRFQLVYDHNILVPRYEILNNQKVKVSEGPGTQFKETLGIGLAYKFGQ